MVMAVKYVALDVLHKLAASHAGIELVGEERPIMMVPPEKLFTVAAYLKTLAEVSMNHLSSLTAVDYPEYIEVVYHLYSHLLKHEVVLKTRVAKPEASLPSIHSVTALWPTAAYQEREVYDLMGVEFAGHPDLRRILLPEEFPGHPLRKDFKLQPRPERRGSTC